MIIAAKYRISFVTVPAEIDWGKGMLPPLEIFL
jgi:hypothetical protein